jgi:RNA polymerase sigma-70 factor (ECF subfamily)
MAAHDEQVTQLVERAGRGDRAAVEELVELFRGDVFRLVYYRTRSRLDAEDITQEIMITMFKELSSLRDASRFKPWLYRMAVNRVHDYHRKKRILTVLGIDRRKSEDESELYELAGNNPGALDHLLRREFWVYFRRFAQGLSRWEREVFFLRFLDQLTIKEIAIALEKSESAVKTHLYRAVSKFRHDRKILSLVEGKVL